ncbi:MAG: nucleotidyltransferase domain-containing protein [Anaerolineales bacterium]|nr:nucleotidyltransferase domain-containing protein [Anaerolineales bacterium]
MKEFPHIPTSLITIIQEWCRTRPVRLCALFGSQASGLIHPHSDIDLAIWPTEPQEPLVKLQWLAELESALKKDVSLVIVTPALDPTLGFEIIKHNCVLYAADESFWFSERSRLWHAYNDSLPFRRAARQKLVDRALEV